MDVDDVTGHVHIVFYDRRASFAKHQDLFLRSTWDTEVYVASSYDGGDTWENLRVSEEKFAPTPKASLAITTTSAHTTASSGPSGRAMMMAS